MATRIQLFLLPVFFLCFITPAHADSSRFGFGYGRDLRSGVNIEQYELFYRRPLPYTMTLGDMGVTTSAEFGLGLIRGTHSGGSGLGRFSVTPELVLMPSRTLSFILGVGAGFMVGDTTISGHDLGGPLLFTGKIGVHYDINAEWGVECDFYHQSNADIYSHNYSLDIGQLAVTYRF